MKCSACQNNECNRDYDQKDKCVGKKEGIECSCSCHVTSAETIGTSALSISAGIAAAGAGVALTIMTGGLAAIIGGAALVGAGSSMVMTPVQKVITGECMTLKESAQDIALGATIGAITGPIGSGASGFAKGASGLVKLGVRAGAGAAAGSVSGAIGETAKVLRGEEVSLGSYAKAIGIGAVAGTVGGASTHIGSNLSKGVASEVGKAATRIGCQATTAAATDAGLQLIDKGEIDTKQMLLNTVGQIAVATSAEISSSVSKRTDAYSQKVNSEMISENLDKDGNKISKGQLETAAKDVNSLKPEMIEENLKKANEYNKVQTKIQEQTIHKENLIKINENSDLSGQQKNQARLLYCKENNLYDKKPLKHINRNLEGLALKSGELHSERFGDKNIHFLHGDRAGQIAVDLAPPDAKTGQRSGERAIFEVHDGKAVYADHTADHKYNDCKKNISNLIPDPFDALRPEHLNQERGEDEEKSGKPKTD